MVTHSGTPARAPHLRALNEPIPVAVTLANQLAQTATRTGRSCAGQPATLTINHHTHAVHRIQDTWIIEDEWWREPIERQYFALLLDDGTRRTVFHDRVANTWYLQDY